MDAGPAGPAEHRLRVAVESSPSGLLMTDARGTIILVNREIERLFGYSRDELLGKPVELLVPERFRGVHSGYRGGFMRDPAARAMGAGRDLFGLRKDGTEFPVEIGLTPVVTEEGVAVISSIVDISARRRAEAMFHAAVESAPNGMVLVDSTGGIVLVNREAERMFGYRREELLGRSVELLVPGRSRGMHPEFRAEFHRIPQARPMGVGRDLKGLRKDGTEFPVEIGLNPIETEDGLLVLASIVDISARQQAEEERRRLEEELRQAQKLEAIGTLAGGIAHDFNNILGTVVGYAELLRRELTGAQHQADLQEILDASERGRELVQQILTFGRRRRVVREPVRLGEVVHKAVRSLRTIVPPIVQVHVRVNVDAPRILGDANAIHQVIINLGTNAAHAMPRGGRIDITVEPFYLRDSVARGHQLEEGSYALLTVQDTGAGMDPTTRARAFEPFFTTKPAGSGTGLGLAIVHGIIREHDGAIELESAPGEGTTFRCLFPALAGEEIVAAGAETDLPLGRGERILFVDDQHSLSRVHQRSLVDLRYRPAVESSGARALELVRRHAREFDAVVTDYSMPDMNGLELARAIHGIRPDLPILLATGHIDELPAEELARAGVVLTLRKPVTKRQLAEALRRALRR